MLWPMGLIGMRALAKEIPGIREVKAKNRERLLRCIVAATALEALRKHRHDPRVKETFECHKTDLGFGLLLKKKAVDGRTVTLEIITKAVSDTVPRRTLMFWSCRIRVGLGVAMLRLFRLTFWGTLKSACTQMRWLLKWAISRLPATWIACEPV